MTDPRWESALAALREDPAIMRQIRDLAATSATTMADIARACAHVMVAATDPEMSRSSIWNRAVAQNRALCADLGKMQEERDEASVRATGATLHTVAGWGDVVLGNGKVWPADELHRIAAIVEAGQVGDWTCCPVCEEIQCDAGCPLAPVRGAAP